MKYNLQEGSEMMAAVQKKKTMKNVNIKRIYENICKYQSEDGSNYAEGIWKFKSNKGLKGSICWKERVGETPAKKV